MEVSTWLRDTVRKTGRGCNPADGKGPGGCVAGLELAAKPGAKYGRKRHDIILIERNRRHFRKPSVHEVTTGSLDAIIRPRLKLHRGWVGDGEFIVRCRCVAS